MAGLDPAIQSDILALAAHAKSSVINEGRIFSCGAFKMSALVEFLLIAFAVVLADRAIASSTLRFVAFSRAEFDQKEFWRCYGWFSFPRTLFAFLICAGDGLGLLFGVDHTPLSITIMVFYVAFGVTAVLNAMASIKRLTVVRS